MIVNLHLAGEAEAYISSLVRRGLAASKTEAIRLCIVKCRDSEMLLEAERRGIEALQSESAKATAGQDASKFYEGKYLHGKKR